MALDRDDDTRDTDRTADDTRTQPAMGGKGQRQADTDNPDDSDDPAVLRAELEAARKRLKHVNREAADRRKAEAELRERLEAIEAAEREKAEATLPEIDKLTKRVQARETELAERQADLEAIADAYNALQVKFAAFQAGAVKVRPERMDAVLRLLDLDSIDRDDETGAPVGIDKAIDAVLKEYPEFAAQTGRAGTPPVPREPGGTPPRRPIGSGNGTSGDPVARAAEQLIQSGKYQRA